MLEFNDKFMSKEWIVAAIMLLLPKTTHAQVDYSVVSVNEEAGVEFTRVTSENDYVCMPKVVRRGKTAS